MRAETYRYTESAGWSAPFAVTDPERTLVVCFGSPRFGDDTDPLREVSEGVGGTLIGCSTAGEILGDRVDDDTLAVAVVEFAHTPLRTAAVPISAETSHEAGAELARRLAAPDLTAVLVLTDGLMVNGSALVDGLNSVLPPEVVVTGGLAGDGDRFERTWVVVDDKPVSGYATAVGLYGDAVRVGHGSGGGWDLFGREREVTRADRNIVYELDGRSIVDLYEEYLGELAEELPSSGLLFPLAVRVPGQDEELVRTILAVDRDDGSLTFAGDVPQGHVVRMMQATAERLIDGAEDAADAALSTVESEPSLSIAISCVGRRLVLGQRTEEELEAVLHRLPDGVAQVGFYSYGEISPYGSGACHLHNQTMTLTTLTERT